MSLKMYNSGGKTRSGICGGCGKGRKSVSPKTFNIWIELHRKTDSTCPMYKKFLTLTI